MNRIVQRNGAAPPWIEIQGGTSKLYTMAYHAHRIFQSLSPPSIALGTLYAIHGLAALSACLRYPDLRLYSQVFPSRMSRRGETTNGRHEKSPITILPSQR